MSPGLLRASLLRGWQHVGPSIMSRVAVMVCLHTGAAPPPPGLLAHCAISIPAPRPPPFLSDLTTGLPGFSKKPAGTVICVVGTTVHAESRTSVGGTRGSQALTVRSLSSFVVEFLAARGPRGPP